jgi:hypothetical protein
LLPASPISPNPGGQALEPHLPPPPPPDAVSAPGRGILRVRLDRRRGARLDDLPRRSPRRRRAADVVTHLPDLGGVLPARLGHAQCRLSGWSWPGLDLASLLWTDIEREHDLSFHAVAQDRFRCPRSDDRGR